MVLHEHSVDEKVEIILVSMDGQSLCKDNKKVKRWS